MANVTDVFTSYDNIRLQIIQQLLDELGLSETDLHRGTFVSYLIDMLSHLTANLMFYSGMSYRESFMTLAQLPESVYNLSAFLGYKPRKASPPLCDVLIQIPLDGISDVVTITFPKDHKFYASDIVYRLQNRVDVFIDTQNQTYKVTVTDVENGLVYPAPYTYDSESNAISFMVSTIQQEEKVFEFVSDPALQPYVFSRYDIEFEEQLSDIQVFVDGVPWTEFDSMYVMRPFDTGFIVRITKTGAAIFFGNGVFGQQPPKSVPIKIHAFVTLGEEGKVASGTIKSGDRIYYDTPAGRKVLVYNVTNPSSSIGGLDMEHIDEVRRNALVHIQSLNRLVSYYDYTNFQTITQLPFRDSLAVLKRSDLKCNEVDLFTTIEFMNEIVPTRTILVSGHIDDLHLKPLDTVSFEGKDYVVLFEYIPDDRTKEVKTLYWAKNISFSPVIQSANLENASIVISNATIDVDLNTKIVTFKLLCEADDITQYTATITIKRDIYEHTWNMTNTGNGFEFAIDATMLPYSLLTLEFKIYKNGDLIIYATTSQTVRQFMDEVTYAHFNWVDEVNREIKYMVPVVEKSWYDSLLDTEKTMFHTEILHKFVEGSVNIYRMLNTNINVLFANTIGRLSNTQYNIPNYEVEQVVVDEPSSPQVGAYYLISNDTSPTSSWYNKQNKIAFCINDNPLTWEFIDPVVSTIVLDKDTNSKLIWNGDEWLQIDVEELPLVVDMDVYVDTTNRDIAKIVQDVKDILYQYFSGSFGILQPLFRSEIIRITQSVDGVVYCKLKSPKFDMFFNFKVSDLSPSELFEFSPDYVYFKDIDIRVTPYTAEVSV